MCWCLQLLGRDFCSSNQAEEEKAILFFPWHVDNRRVIYYPRAPGLPGKCCYCQLAIMWHLSDYLRV